MSKLSCLCLAISVAVITAISNKYVMAQGVLINKSESLVPSALENTRSQPAETLAASRNDTNWKIPRTSWGHPDLQGIWTSDDMRGVPRDRPAQFGDRLSLSAEEFAERASRDQASMNRATNDESFLRNEYGIRTFGYSSLVVEPANGKIPEMTPMALVRAAGRDRGTFGSGPFAKIEDFTLYDRCITRGIVGSILPVLYGNGLRIIQTPDSVVLSYEMIHDTRIIPLDNKPFLAGEIRQYLGNSRAHWEDETLVIESHNFTDRTSIGGNGNGIRHSEDLVLTERMTRVDNEQIDYYITVDDPKTYTDSFTLRFTITSQPGYQVYEYSCHEGNSAVRNTLSGEREFERQVAEALAKGLPVPTRENTGNIYGLPEEGAEVRNFNTQ